MQLEAKLSSRTVMGLDQLFPAASLVSEATDDES